MQVCGNGYMIDIDSAYNSPYIKVSTEGQNNVYYVVLPYEKGMRVHSEVSNVLRDYGKESNFWDILGNHLELKFDVIIDQVKKKIRDNTKTSKPKRQKMNIAIDCQEDTVNHVALNYDTDKMECEIILTLSSGETKQTIVPYKKSWSHKKIVDKVFNDNQHLNKGAFLNYSWNIA